MSNEPSQPSEQPNSPLARLIEQDEQRRRGPKERFTIRKVMVALRAAAGTYSGAAALLGCQPNTVRNYIRRHKKLQEFEVELRDEVLDLAETKLMEAVRQGDQKAVQFLLRCKGKDRGWVERQEVVGRNGGPVSINLSEMTDQELERIARGESPPAKSPG